MLRNYLKVAWRNAWRNKLWSSINILSLALGLAACILILLFIEDERSFDAFHSNKDHIYRLDEVQSFPGTNTQKVALSMPGMGPALLKDYPQIKSFTRYWGRGKNVFKGAGEQFLLEQAVVVDSSFLQIFDFALLEGSRKTALTNPYSIVLTEQSARKIFGNQSPIGQTLRREDSDFQVTGIIEDVPENSHLQFDALISMSTVTTENPNFDERFGSNFLVTYLLMKEGTDIKALESEMPDFLLRCMPPDPESTQDVNDFYKIFFQELSGVHLASADIEHDYHNYRKFNGSYLGIFTIVGFLILIIAVVNFMNLMTARASHRWKEVGIRKTIGAVKQEMFQQFSVEALILGFIAFGVGMVVALASIPLLNTVLDRDLSLTYFTLHPNWMMLAFASTLGLSLLASLYPAYVLSARQTVDILHGGDHDTSKSIFRSSLIILQFGLAIGLIICTLIVIQQMNHIKNKDIGLNKDHILLVDLNEDANKVFSTLKTELNRNPLVKGVTASGQRLGNNFHQWGFKFRSDSIQNVTPSNVNVDFDYLDVYEMEIVAGRKFSKERPLDDGQAFIINESFARELGVENPVGLAAGHSWYPDDSLGSIIGVVKDFNFNSLHYSINTLAMVVHTDWGYDELSIKIDGSDIQGAIAQIRNIWEGLVPTWPFQYSFLDEHFQDLYKSDKQMEAVVVIMAILAILIACMGLFGLAAITIEKKMKEVGIRKVLGASAQSIIIYLSQKTALLVLVAFLVFCPITYLVMQKWLQNFADRISIQPFVFAVGFFIALGIAMATMTYHTARAAFSNPVNALRDD